VAKAELGTKRQCRNCSTRFYDLNRDPIICPKCDTVFQPHELRPTPQAPAEVVAEDDVKTEAAAGPELVSLEEADAGAADKVLVADEDVETADPDVAETFLEEEEEGDDDVSTLIDGDIEDDEEA
jgi:uncharacterized protein (TIGR02300 family)